ncbi:MAG: type II secretion system F family protein, partial [Clostridiales bacterium]|nr:type II secretion system F family protein [Clostridiales bacterium]
MPSYQYTATNMSGQKVSGMFEAASEESVRYMLRQKSYYPLDIHPISARRNLGEIELFPR